MEVSESHMERVNRVNEIFSIQDNKGKGEAYTSIYCMQIESMGNDFRNLTAKVWTNLDNPIKSYDFSKFWLISRMPPSQVALC